MPIIGAGPVLPLCPKRRARGMLLPDPVVTPGDRDVREQHCPADVTGLLFKMGHATPSRDRSLHAAGSTRHGEPLPKHCAKVISTDRPQFGNARTARLLSA